MGLEELNEKLHGRDVHLDRAKPYTPFDPGRGTTDPTVEPQFQKKEAWQASIPKGAAADGLILTDIPARTHRRHIAFVLGGIALLLLLGGLVFKGRGMLFSEGRIEVTISGPKSVTSAEEATFTVTYANKNWAGLSDATLILSYPDSFHPQTEKPPAAKGSLVEIPLGKIKAKATGQVPITGKFYGSKGDLVSLKATLRYTPENIATVFESAAQFTVNVASSPLSLEITAPLELATGQDIEYVIDYGNTSDVSFSNLRMKLEYPEGFHFVSAEPKPSEGESVWYVGNLNARAEGKITIRGVLAGARDERKRVRATIGFFQGDGNFAAYAENERQTRIIASLLSISQTVNGLTDIAVNPGDVLRYVIRYRNDSEIGVRDAIITLVIDSPALDMRHLILASGAYDAARKTITWKASDIAQLGKLEPGASGTIDFSVPVLATPPAGGEKGIAIRSIATIDSPDIPSPLGSNKIIASNTLFVKLNAVVGVDIKALYDDPVFPNSGPIPPKVGQETSYTLHLNITNSSNDLKQARVSVTLPTGIRYNRKFSPGSETVMFNERTNELTWELGVFSPTKGVARELVFQVATTPSPSSAGQPLILIQSVAFTATDTFTNQDIRVEKGETDNFLREDKTYGSSGSHVQAAD